MRTTCLRPPQKPIFRNVLRLLNVPVRFYGADPRHAPPPADSCTTNKTNNVSGRDEPHNINARHWLRGILRECTYLPDPKARQYVSQHAISRFRTYDFKTWKNKKKPIHGFQERMKAKEREARLAINLLKRANEGEPKPLLKVLNMAYGRVGKRRHELMAPLLIRPAEEDSSAATGSPDDRLVYDQFGENTLQHSSEEESGKEKSPSSETKAILPPALYQLLESQRLVDPPSKTRPNPRRLRPEIPALNSKMRPMPASRVKNLTKKWYADLLDRVLPPLPADEWYQLRDLAHGHGISKQPQRRKAPQDMKSIALRDDNALDMVIMGGSRRVDKRVFGNHDAHTITRRYMQRMYAIVFRQCPVMEFDTETNKWCVTWGKYALDSYRRD